MSRGSTQGPGDGDGKAGGGGGGQAPLGKDGTVSAELTSAILLSHLFIYINKRVVLLKGHVEAGSLMVMASVNSGRDGEGFLFSHRMIGVYFQLNKNVD